MKKQNNYSDDNYYKILTKELNKKSNNYKSPDGKYKFSFTEENVRYSLENHYNIEDGGYKIINS